MTPIADKIIVALDVATAEEARRLVKQLGRQVSRFKVGLQLYTAAGPELVREIAATGAKVFLDLKLHDIPNTVARAVESAVGLDVQMLTLHLCGGSDMIRTAVSVAPDTLLLLGVTVLTSANSETLREIGIIDDVSHQVVRLAKIGVDCGIGGVVASAREIGALRKAIDRNVKLVIPGIRPPGSEKHDQRRTMTPAQAVAAGADYLVVGRAVTSAPDPTIAAKQIVEQIESAL